MKAMFKMIVKGMLKKNGLDSAMVTDEMFNEIWHLFEVGNEEGALAKIDEMIANAKR